MGVRSWVRERREVDGQSEEGMAAVRAASLQLYGTTYGNSSSFQTGPAAFYGVDYVPPLAFNSRKKVANQAANTNPLLLGPMWRIATRIGALPIKVFEIDEKTGERSDDSQHPGYKLLRRPNDILTRPLLFSGTTMSMLQYGAAYWFKQRKNGKVVELWPIPAPIIAPVRSATSLVSYFRLTQNGKPTKLKTKDVCFFRMIPDPANWMGNMSPLQALGEVSDFGSSALEASTEFFDKSILGRIYIDMHGKELTPPARRRLAAQMEIARRDRFGVPVLEDGATMESMGIPPDAAFLTSAIDSARKMVNETLGMPDQENNDFERLFYGEVIQPIADAIEQELERSLFVEWPNKPAFPEFQFREILAGDPLQRAQLHHIKILSAQETPDEARKSENLPPLPDGAGEQAFLPLNLTPIDMAGKQVAVSNTPPLPERPASEGGLGGTEGKGTKPKGGKVSNTGAEAKGNDKSTTPGT